MRGHRAVVAVLRKALEATGAAVDLERTIPELVKVQSGGAVQEAIMDLVVAWPGAGAPHWIDVSIRCPFATRYACTRVKVGAAAADGEAEKRARYGRCVEPVVFETAGRIGANGLAVLAGLQRDARLFGRKRLGGSPGLNLRAVRAALEAALVRHDADATLLALGALGTVALGWVPPARRA